MNENALSPEKLVTVTGCVDPGKAGITDAHNHVWIAPVAGGSDHAPVLDNENAITSELVAYRRVGGGTIIDCQPVGCGRDGRVLQRLAQASGVNIVACTGFHLRRYYPDNYSLFGASPEAVCALFVSEIREHLAETTQVRAGFIKIACEETLETSPAHLLEAAVMASRETGVGIEVHTEKGADADRIVRALIDFGLAPTQLVICHIDKRVDFAFHSELAAEGVMLEYDTFFRSKYQPDDNVWPLLQHMIEAGLASQVAIATDMADSAMWSSMGQGPGLTGLISQIIPRLRAIGCDDDTVLKLTGENIVHRLAYVPQGALNG